MDEMRRAAAEYAQVASTLFACDGREPGPQRGLLDGFCKVERRWYPVYLHEGSCVARLQSLLVAAARGPRSCGRLEMSFLTLETGEIEEQARLPLPNVMWRIRGAEQLYDGSPTTELCKVQGTQSHTWCVDVTLFS